MIGVKFRDHSLNLAEQRANSGSVVRMDVPSLLNEPNVEIPQRLLISEVSECLVAYRCFGDHAVLSQNRSRICENYSKVIQ